MLSLIWFRTPGNGEHGYGPGSPQSNCGTTLSGSTLGRTYQRAQDKRLVRQHKLSHRFR
ncbi:protein of unknown function (plasmid) [Cupriavidus taiwanensis]|uniref:Uncharacterized protein n=1 Tax=Cupriavidus taiwanensis TaxID=164546 RepID=A0A375FGA8_9BURK|nr:protein of unknown function [Cupriavidus taiwanensis]SOZ74398.1 protein of unknown function [Cupriavidus taiwanensis]SPA57244.1 protein of unknown function [Cupriavidus taiwanensis]